MEASFEEAELFDCAAKNGHLGEAAGDHTWSAVNWSIEPCSTLPRCRHRLLVAELSIPIQLSMHLCSTLDQSSNIAYKLRPRHLHRRRVRFTSPCRQLPDHTPGSMSPRARWRAATYKQNACRLLRYDRKLTVAFTRTGIATSCEQTTARQAIISCTACMQVILRDQRLAAK